MELQSVTTVTQRTAGAFAAYHRARPSESFRSILDAAGPPLSTHVVRRGETLSQIVEHHLERGGRQASVQEIYAGVARVAAANNQNDPDVIIVNQRINLSALGTDGRALVPQNRTDRSARPPLRDAQPWQRLLAAPARLTSTFGPRPHPIRGTSHHHAGIDLAVQRGTRVYPLSGGVVMFSGYERGYGNVVIVRHDNGVESLYGHNRKNLVRTGERVERDTAVALTGSSGRSTGPHLHFEIRANGRAIDPLPVLNARDGEAKVRHL